MSFQLSATYYGLCLFRRGAGGTVVRINLPDTTKDPTHADGSPAKVHYARFAIPRDAVRNAGEFKEGPDGWIVVSLDTFVVGFPIPKGAPDAKALDTVVPFNRFVDNFRVRDNVKDLSAASIEITSGEFEPLNSPPAEWMIPNTLTTRPPFDATSFGYNVTWTATMDESARAEPAITFTTPSGAPALPAMVLKTDKDVAIILGNVCNPDPVDWPNMPVETCPGPDPCIDQDFKWLYKLLEPTDAKTWEQRLHGKPLPVPEYLGPFGGGGTKEAFGAPRFITTPQCMPGGCDDC
jgi:hypothetical protein